MKTTTTVVIMTMMAAAAAMMVTSGGTAAQQLTPDFYNTSCPKLQGIVRSTMFAAVRNETRMAASLLRLFFHDCFVQGCDASVLLDDTSTMTGEKSAFPNINSIRGFEVVDTIKANVEAACPGVVSCADILALASHDGVVLSGGPMWSVPLGRRDSLTASYSLANANLPTPSEDVDTLIAKFQAQGLSVQDLVTLSGAHTIGQARCTSFKERLYTESAVDVNPTYLSYLQSICPSNGSDDNLAALDVRTPVRFDACYYFNLINKRGLLHSDQELYSNNTSSTMSIVQSYSKRPWTFYTNFPISMIAMGNLNPLVGTAGEIRKNCHFVN